MPDSFSFAPSPSFKLRDCMKHWEVPLQIRELCRTGTLSFVDRYRRIAHLLDGVTESELLEHVDYAGVIPESFAHDSTEEKLYAKYCDSLLAASLQSLGMAAEAIAERSDAADVEASFGRYRLVGDAKAFRLSRTAKNQKDFKVEALDGWRRGAEYACLIAPLYQYPSLSSQIYSQALKRNVTLLSYVHLGYLLRHKPKPRRLRDLWAIGPALAPTKNAAAYWRALDGIVCAITASKETRLRAAIQAERNRLSQIANEQISFWEHEKQRIAQLPHEIAVNELIAALKIDSKIDTIRKTAQLAFPQD